MQDDLLTNPEDVSLASNSRRTLATILNYFLFSIFTGILTKPVTMLVSKDVMDLSGVMMLIAIPLYIYFESAFGGTPGKILMDLRVVDAETHKKISYSRALKRTFQKFIQVTGIFSLIGTLFNTAKNEFPHDEATGTIVINSNE